MHIYAHISGFYVHRILVPNHEDDKDFGVILGIMVSVDECLSGWVGRCAGLLYFPPAYAMLVVVKFHM
jgi:hypothetical protein